MSEVKDTCLSCFILIGMLKDVEDELQRKVKVLDILKPQMIFDVLING